MASDPRCPACGSPVGMTASYCMHCDADFDAPVGVDDTTGASADDTSDDDTTGASADDISDDDTGGGDSATLTTWEQRFARWLGPDGWIDNSLTIVVAICVGLVAGPLTAIVLALFTGSLWSLAVGVVAWLGTTAHLANQRTVYGAVRGGCFGVAGLLVVLPVGFVLRVSENPLAQLDVLLAFELLAGTVAIALLVVGVIAGRLRKKITGEAGITN